MLTRSPALKCWAIINRPVSRDCFRDFLCKAYGRNVNLRAQSHIPFLGELDLKQLLSVLLTLALTASVVAQAVPKMRTDEYRRAHERQIITEFARLLEIPNVASDLQNIRRNAELIHQMMQRRGLNPRLLETASKSTPPAVYGEWKTPGATHSLIFYAHYDGQPTDPGQWTGTLPWQPTWRSAATGIRRENYGVACSGRTNQS